MGSIFIGLFLHLRSKPFDRLFKVCLELSTLKREEEKECFWVWKIGNRYKKNWFSCLISNLKWARGCNYSWVAQTEHLSVLSVFMYWVWACRAPSLATIIKKIRMVKLIFLFFSFFPSNFLLCWYNFLPFSLSLLLYNIMQKFSPTYYYFVLSFFSTSKHSLGFVSNIYERGERKETQLLFPF